MKFDFLGLKTLTVLARAQELLAKRGVDIDFSSLPLDDPATYRMLGTGEATGVFQLESQGMRDVLRRLQPDRFEDIIARGRALPPGPDGEHPELHRAQARPGAARLSAPLARADPERDLRHHHLPGTGDADRPDALGLQPGARRRAAPRHGQEEQGRDGGRARALRRRRGRARRRRSPRPARSSTWSTSSPATASTSRTPRPMRWSPTRPPI